MTDAPPDRRVLTLTGTDVLPFLQGLVTNDVLPLSRGPGLVYAALLTPQGKYLCDFFVGNLGDRLILDLPEMLAEATLRRLAMYRLRADVRWQPTGETVARGLGPAPAGALADPRHPGLGWRLYGGTPSPVDWDALRVDLVVPETGAELVPDDSYILEMGFERLHGVDFRKGCYVGQEVTARMKHKTDLRKGLVRVGLAAAVAPGTPILTADGREAGVVRTVSGLRALAWLRFDRISDGLSAGGIGLVSVSAADSGEILSKG
jgi:hypothetical protein